MMPEHEYEEEIIHALEKKIGQFDAGIGKNPIDKKDIAEQLLDLSCKMRKIEWDLSLGKITDEEAIEIEKPLLESLSALEANLDYLNSK
jgi:hypothetical protein